MGTHSLRFTDERIEDRRRGGFDLPLRSKLWGRDDHNFTFAKVANTMAPPNLEPFPSIYDGRRHTEQHRYSLVILCLG